LINNPPENVEYITTKNQKGVIINKRFFWFSNLLKKMIRKITGFLNLPIPNAHLTRSKEKYDLIHCAHCLSLNNKNPWVADVECLWSLWVSGQNSIIGKKIVREILLRKNCKKILPWTNVTKNEIEKFFPEIKNKIEVVYPAVPLVKIKSKRHKEINLLFISRYFYEKGGLHALETINQLTKKYENVSGIVVSEVPKEILNKYSKNKKIKFYELMPQKELFENIFPTSDIFVYPGYSDSFGFAYLEAMGFGIPIITVDGFARKEIIDEGKTGFVIERPDINWKKYPPIFENEEITIKNLIKKTEQLIKNKTLREKMSKNCINKIKFGKFSIKERNKKLKRIYGGH